MEWTPTLPKPSVFVKYTVSRELKKRYLNDLSQLLYNVVCRSWGCLFCKKQFLPVDFLCCCFCINALLFSACCNFGVVAGCDSFRASTCHVKTKCLNVPRYLYFLTKATFPLNDSKLNKCHHFTFWLGFSDFYCTIKMDHCDSYDRPWNSSS